MSSTPHHYVLRLSCPDRVGVVANVTLALAGQGLNVLEAHHFRDGFSNRSVMRILFESPDALDESAFAQGFDRAMASFGLDWSLRSTGRRTRVVIAVSKQGHCLNSLLHRWSTGTLPVDVLAIVSNHEDQRRLADWHGLPFHHLPIAAGAKEVQERAMLELFSGYRADLLVLARYMQILTATACRELKGRAINIHHSFLPGFKGAKPYHQAYQRGVKLIGATAHYVNEDLDEGPIIEQAVERVDHTYTPEQLTTIGNDIESVVLNRAVQWHAEDRVFEFGNRTVVLR
jgi:formyltetrahydrofolate deformylase